MTTSSCWPSTGRSVSTNGQKEKRIVDTLRPVMQRHRLIFHRRALDDDFKLLAQYPTDQRNIRSVFHQIHNITTDRGSLQKDDRIDALEGLVRELTPALLRDDEAATRSREKSALMEFLTNPMGIPKRHLENKRAKRRRL